MTKTNKGGSDIGMMLGAKTPKQLANIICEVFSVLNRDVEVSDSTQPLYFTRYLGQEWQFARADALKLIVPIAKPKSVYAVAIIDPEHGQFQNALFIGTFREALEVFVSLDTKMLTSWYSDYLLRMTPDQLHDLRQNLSKAMREELKQEDLHHEQQVQSINGRYRNQLNFFTSMHDQALAKQDLENDVSYTFEIDGYPVSKPYATYKEARRTHSKRNVPHLGCIIRRHVPATKKTKASGNIFASWSLTHRTWELV